MAHQYNGSYSENHLDRIAFPIGGIGAGMFCIEGRGTISHMSIMHEPDVFSEPTMFAAISVKNVDHGSRILEGPVPKWRYFGTPGSGNGGHGKIYGLPRFDNVSFSMRFPFASIDLSDESLPIDVNIEAYSPFIPGNANDSSLPVGSITYSLSNKSDQEVDTVFSYHALNFLDGPVGTKRVDTLSGGLILKGEQASFAVSCDHPQASIDGQLFRGGWFDATTVIWKNICDGEAISHAALPVSEETQSPGGSIYVPLTIAGNTSVSVTMLFAWYVPYSHVRSGYPTEESCGPDCACTSTSPPEHHRPWYSTQYEGVKDVLSYWEAEEKRVRSESRQFSDCFYDSTLPPEVIEAVAANLTILKSPTCLRLPDGKFWAWEGCTDTAGCCPGSCTHVWNYAQALPHLFPDLERSMRRIEFSSNQGDKGQQSFRARLPVSDIPPNQIGKQASDGQLGGIMKVYRDYRISGDVAWLEDFWPLVKQSLDFCIEEWDPDHIGALIEPHHNTYDIEFWGPDGMCTSFYCGALLAAAKMAVDLGDDNARERYEELYAKSRSYMENELYNGEYFIQHVRWTDLHAEDPSELQSWSVNYSEEAKQLLQNEGPKYQYGSGCLSDGILGAWIAEMAGLSDIVDRKKITSHLNAVHAHNLKEDLTLHANPQRPTYALGDEAGLLLCSWPHGGQPTLPFVYSNEVWTGIEYQVASHLIISGEVKKGLEIVRAARDRYDGEVRNPFNEYECGHWYARAMASYGLLSALSGVRYDAVDKILYVKPVVTGDFRSFISTASGYGTAGMKGGEAFLDVVSGSIPVDHIEVR